MAKFTLIVVGFGFVMNGWIILGAICVAIGIFG